MKQILLILFLFCAFIYSDPLEVDTLLCPLQPTNHLSSQTVGPFVVDTTIFTNASKDTLILDSIKVIINNNISDSIIICIGYNNRHINGVSVIEDHYIYQSSYSVVPGIYHDSLNYIYYPNDKLFLQLTRLWVKYEVPVTSDTILVQFITYFKNFTDTLFIISNYSNTLSTFKIITANITNTNTIRNNMFDLFGRIITISNPSSGIYAIKCKDFPTSRSNLTIRFQRNSASMRSIKCVP